MILITRTPTLTGVAVGGTIIRPTAALLVWLGLEVFLRTQRIVTPTIPNPLEDMREIAPTILTVMHVAPGVG
jgi:hypothetical protein